MSEYPILFNGPMVRAIMTCADCGTMSVLPACPKCGSTRRLKTMTRRVIKCKDGYSPFTGTIPALSRAGFWQAKNCWIANDLPLPCPYGQPGDTLIVKETWQYNPYGGIVYRAGSGIVDCDGRGWRPSTNMPRWASRLTLRLLDVRVERLQDITEEDAEAEGCDGDCGIGYIPAYQAGPCQYQFAQLWDTINGKKYPWEGNWWVWVLIFEIAGQL